MKIKRIHVFLALVGLCVCAILFRTQFRRPVASAIKMMKGEQTTAGRVAQFGDAVHARLHPMFQKIGVAYPPGSVRLVGLKAEQRLEVWVSGPEGVWRNIMIHGKNRSVGCLAMGDEAAEDLFVLAAQTGIDNVSVLLSPVDFRVRELPADMPPTPAWTPQLYDEIRRELKMLGESASPSNLPPRSPVQGDG